MIIAVADVLVEAVEPLHVSIVQVTRGQVGTPSEPPFPRHLGEQNQKKNRLFVEKILLTYANRRGKIITFRMTPPPD